LIFRPMLGILLIKHRRFKISTCGIQMLTQ
jgi:hypothetical protein